MVHESFAPPRAVPLIMNRCPDWWWWCSSQATDQGMYKHPCQEWASAPDAYEHGPSIVGLWPRMVEPCICRLGRSGGWPCTSLMGIMPSGAHTNVRLIYHRTQQCLTLEWIQWLSYVSRGSDLPRQIVGGFCNLNGWQCVVWWRLQICATVWFWSFWHPSIDDQWALHPSSLENGGWWWQQGGELGFLQHGKVANPGLWQLNTRTPVLFNTSVLPSGSLLL